MTCVQATKTTPGAVLLISAAASLTHVGALLRRFGFAVHELYRVPTPGQMVDHHGPGLRLAIVEEALCIGAGVDPLTLLLDMPSQASIVIVPQADSRRDEPSTARCRYLPPSFSPLDLTLTIVDALKWRAGDAN
ncbi:hypothetical protein SAMN02745121_06247 [Nannocystis exedens]|uniref:Uncharacterized protein n=1 Tax=Nannocystis exedens TaxID=54 RepID=A0A1I2ET03_9BACT|nr:hypothetical protein [Nannocystis exedens]PCC73834.1 hypothetical protein NAEX_06922 [Nannocystis exedens]SFE95588.1 hypothetical protein SAMN02745121_06247 [Nannocystis exedens]